MKVALIGANSFIARNLYVVLAAEGVQLTLYSRLQPNHAPLARWRRFSSPEWPPRIIDLLEFDVIVYTAATGVQRSSAPPDAANLLQVNASLPLQLAAELNCQKWRGRWISFGSYFEIGEQSERPFSEEEVIHSNGPSPGPYCDTKRALTRGLAAQRWQMPLHHFILPTIYGANEDRLRLIPYVLDCLSSGTPPQLSAGSQIRQYLHVSDLCRLLLLALSGQVPPGILNAAPRECISVAEVVRAIYALTGRRAEPPFSTAVTRDEGMRFLALSPERILATSSWRVNRDLNDGLRDYLFSHLR
jgi:nucleoside-diphosphate-sugar epimerase